MMAVIVAVLYFWGVVFIGVGADGNAHIAGPFADHYLSLNQCVKSIDTMTSKYTETQVNDMNLIGVACNKFKDTGSDADNETK